MGNPNGDLWPLLGSQPAEKRQIGSGSEGRLQQVGRHAVIDGSDPICGRKRQTLIV
jgi:hypothetical protein